MPFLPEIQGLNFIKFDPDQKYDLIVVDNYALTKGDYDGLYKQTNKILVLDDLCNRQLNCDFLWDPTITRKKNEYHRIVPDTCKLFLGGKYQIFSDQHITMALLYGEKQKLSADTIHLYGGQTNKLDLSIICVALSKKFKVNVLGHLNERLPHVSKNVTISISSMNPIETFWNCKLGVGSPGNMLWERGSIGIPSYVIMNNPNQQKICDQLHKAGLLELGLSGQKETLAEEIESIEKLFYDQGKLEKMGQKLRNSINIRGKSLLVKEILRELY